MPVPNCETETGYSVVPTSAPMAEVKTAVAGFVTEFKMFRDQMTDRMKQQESRMTMLDRKTHAGARPALARDADTGAPHQKAFGAYLRSGDDDALRGLTLEGKAMSTAVAADGGGDGGLVVAKDTLMLANFKF